MSARLLNQAGNHETGKSLLDSPTLAKPHHLDQEQRMLALEENEQAIHREGRQGE